MYSIAATSRGPCWFHADVASSRSAPVSVTAWRSSRQRTSSDGPAWTRDDLERRLGHDAERALGADEEIDEIHSRPRVVACRQLWNVGHAVAGHRNGRDAAVGELDFERAIVARPNIASRDVEDIAVCQHDRDSLDPSSRRAVFERRRTCSIRGNGAADERAIVRGHWRVIQARRRETLLEHIERHAGTCADISICGAAQCRQPACAENDLATWRGAAGQ